MERYGKTLYSADGTKTHMNIQLPAHFTALTKPNTDDSSRYGACSTTTRSTTMAHKLQTKFDPREMDQTILFELYDVWAELRLQSSKWQEHNLGYCAAAFGSDGRSARIVVVCYLFKNQRDLRRFKLWCDLHGLQVEDCSDADNAKKNT